MEHKYNNLGILYSLFYLKYELKEIGFEKTENILSQAQDALFEDLKSQQLFDQDMQNTESILKLIANMSRQEISDLVTLIEYQNAYNDNCDFERLN